MWLRSKWLLLQGVDQGSSSPGQSSPGLTSSYKLNLREHEKVIEFMNSETALKHVESSLREGADLRLKVAHECGPAIVQAAGLMLQSLYSGGKLLFFGNGGSAADAQHLAAEFVGRFVKERRGLPAVALTTDSSIVTAVGNDYGFERIFSRQIEALGNPGDVAIGISSTGNSPNVIAGIKQAVQQNLKTIGLSGRDGGALASCVDIALVVRCPNTARVQECHIAIGHLLCELTENAWLEKQHA